MEPRHSRMFRSYVSSPASRRRAVAVLERAAECRLRRVADVLRDERDRKGGVAELGGGGVQAYVREIGGRRLPDASDEPRRERRPGKAARSGQLLDRPVVAGVSMDGAQGRTDLWVERTGEPVRFGVGARGPGAQDLDEEQIEDAGDHHRRSLGGRLHLEYEHPAGHFEPFERWAASAAQDDHGREAREQVAGLRVADRECSAEPARRVGCPRVMLGCADANDRVLALACVAQVVRVAAREQDDIAATHVLDLRVAVDPKHEFAFFNDVEGADVGEADRDSLRRSVGNDPFSAQTDAPEQLREQVVRLAMYGEAERSVLDRWRIGKLSWRSEQVAGRRWTIGKMFRRSGHCLYRFLGLRSTNSEWSAQSDGLGTFSHRTDVARPERKTEPMASRAAEAGPDKPTKISFVYSNPTDPVAFEAAYPEQLALARKLPGLTRLQTSRVWPREDGSPTPAYRLLDLYFADYAAASDAAAEASALVGATLEHATGGVVIAFAEVLDDA
jgi:uncharacterized protein (TIGR02118 family)